MDVTARSLQARADTEVIRHLKDNPTDSSNFRLLYDRYSPATYVFFLRRVGDPAAAEDLNQELFLELSRSIDRFEGKCSWRTWVFLIARAVLADFRLKRWKYVENVQVELDAEGLGGEIALDVDAGDEAEKILLTRRLKICLRRLSDVARVVVIGHYFRGITLRELTESLSLTNPSGSRSVLLAAQRKLRSCLEHWEKS